MTARIFWPNTGRINGVPRTYLRTSLLNSKEGLTLKLRCANHSSDVSLKKITSTIVMISIVLVSVAFLSSFQILLSDFAILIFISSICPKIKWLFFCTEF